MAEQEVLAMRNEERIRVISLCVIADGSTLFFLRRSTL